MNKKLRKVLLAVALLVSVPLVLPSCGTPPTQRVAQVQTLKAVGHSAETAIELSAKLYRDGKITAAKAREIADLYDKKFQPAYRLAVSAVKANLDSPASPELVDLAQQLLNLSLEYTK